MHILIITPAGKTVKVDVGDETDPMDINNHKLITPEEIKIQDPYSSTSVQSQPNLAEQKKLQSRRSVHFSNAS